MKIDPHVHCRDGEQSFKETISHVLRLCDEQGVDIVFDMPNTEPPLLTADDVDQRLRLIPSEDWRRYRLFLGATADEKQLREAARMAQTCDHVVGLKLYAGASTGTLAIQSEREQEKVYARLAALDYRGVLAVHCEKESLFTKVFDPARPSSHSEARPPAAETASLDDQIRFARETGFRGILHICHISTAESLERVKAARKHMLITCGVTPHHLLWSVSQTHRPDGLIYKVNPPLRDPSDTIALRLALKQGDINWLESDHAPHPISEKLYPPYASGYPSLCLYRQMVEEYLPFWGVTADQIKKLTCDNIKQIFFVKKGAH